MRTRMSWLIAAVLLGLGLRAYHYLRGPAVWQDEAALILNVLDKDYGALLGPLRFHEAAPPLFLWLEKAVSTTLGDEPLALRLPPFLASCAALLLMVPVARRLLPAAAVPWAVLLFACSEQLSWHACEAKPYAFDVLAATVLLFICVSRGQTENSLARHTSPPCLDRSRPTLAELSGMFPPRQRAGRAAAGRLPRSPASGIRCLEPPGGVGRARLLCRAPGPDRGAARPRHPGRLDALFP